MGIPTFDVNINCLSKSWVVNITGICTQINTRKKVVFNENGSGHFAPKLGGHFKLELGGQYHWNLQLAKNIDEVRPKTLMMRTDILVLNKLGKPFTVDGVGSIIEPLKCLFPDRKLNPQTIRMSVICNWLNERKLTLEQTQELSGHKWIGTTEKYIKSDAKNERELINRYFPKL